MQHLLGVYFTIAGTCWGVHFTGMQHLLGVYFTIAGNCWGNISLECSIFWGPILLLLGGKPSPFRTISPLFLIWLYLGYLWVIYCLQLCAWPWLVAVHPPPHPIGGCSRLPQGLPTVYLLLGIHRACIRGHA